MLSLIHICKHIVTTPAKICGVLGITVPDQTMIDILQRLEFTVDVQADGSWDGVCCTRSAVPSVRAMRCRPRISPTPDESCLLYTSRGV